ncbi:MAG: hypothetical protein GX557_01780 [Chloroflexi bacterium]|nr:hypothetical protein [Chloroflexota bacterium]
MRHNRWLLSLVLALTVLLVGAWPVAAQGGSSNAVFNQDYVLAEGQTLNQDLLVVGGSVRLERNSVVRGNVAVTGGNAQLDGLVEGDVVVLGGDTELGPEALIRGDVVAFGQLRRSDTAQVLGSTVEGLAASQGFKYLPRLLQALPGVRSSEGEIEPVDMIDPGTRSLGSAGSVLLMLVAAVLAAALLPVNLVRTARTMRHSALLSIGVGLLTVLLAALLSVLLVVICIGIPVAIVLLLALALAYLFGWVSASWIVGHKLLAQLKIKATLMGETVAGTAVIGLVGLIPCLGWLMSLVVSCWGIGAVVLTRFGAAEYPATLGSGVTPAGSAVAGQPVVPPLAPLPPEEPKRETKPLDPEAPIDPNSE